MTIYDALSLVTPGTCSNCEARVDKLLRGRCQACHNYFIKKHRERPAAAWQPVAPVWGEFEPTPKEIKASEIYCDCGQLATQTLTLPISGRGKTRLLLCDEHAALEKRLAPVHSWVGG